MMRRYTVYNASRRRHTAGACHWHGAWIRSPAGASSVRPSSGKSSFTLGDVGSTAKGPATRAAQRCVAMTGSSTASQVTDEHTV